MARSGRDYIGPYRLVRPINSSQTCQVWEAVHDTKGGRFALKVLQSKHRDEKDLIESLRHEFTVGKNMDHTNVIHIYDFNIDRNIPYLVEEIFSIRNMKQAILEGAESLPFLVPKMIVQAALALEHFHLKGWLHCDVKPDNFLVNDEGVVKMIDFSIAQKHVTGLGRLFAGRNKVQGTRSYMSPEQIRGQALGPLSDVYSYGCMLFELVAGKKPFTGFNADDLLSKHLRAPIPSLLAATKGVLPEFADFVIELMAKKPEQRPSSMTKVLERLEKIRVYRARTRKKTNSSDSN